MATNHVVTVAIGSGGSTALFPRRQRCYGDGRKGRPDFKKAQSQGRKNDCLEDGGAARADINVTDNRRCRCISTMATHAALTLLWERSEVLPKRHNGATPRDERPFPPAATGITSMAAPHVAPVLHGSKWRHTTQSPPRRYAYGREPGQDGGAHAVPPSLRARITTPTPRSDLKPLLLPTNRSFTSAQPQKSPFRPQSLPVRRSWRIKSTERARRSTERPGGAGSAGSVRCGLVTAARPPTNGAELRCSGFYSSGGSAHSAAWRMRGSPCEPSAAADWLAHICAAAPTLAIGLLWGSTTRLWGIYGTSPLAMGLLWGSTTGLRGIYGESHYGAAIGQHHWAMW
uniref:Uncharacterized protein n=1 Tax=Meleagris gallopavo TaxID=9103 RepID=E3T0B5_MELGA|nr:hypothetical protein [Meleagris gallopavo]